MGERKTWELFAIFYTARAPRHSFVLKEVMPMRTIYTDRNGAVPSQQRSERQVRSDYA
jgi:hypothetical protein